MRILVTGGLGFQGTHLSKRLVELGHNVYIISTASLDAMNNLRYLNENLNKEATGTLTRLYGTITDINMLDRVIPQVDVVFHLAAKVNVDESIENPQIFIDTNITATRMIMDLCVKNNVRLIMASTCEVYGGGKDLDENSPLLPKSPYAASKAGADRMAYAYAQTYDLKVDIVRPFNVYGPLQKEGKFGAVIAIFANKALNKEPITIYGDGSQARDFIFIDDVVEGYLAILETETEDDNPCRVFTFGTGVETSVKEIAEIIVKEIPGTEILYDESRPGEVDTFIAKKKIEDYFPDKKTTPFKEGMKKYLEFKRK